MVIFSYEATTIATVVYNRKLTKNVSININDTLKEGC